MTGILLSCVIGCVYGLVVGLLPGASIATGMILVLPILLQIPPQDSISFYISMATVVQYFGATSASLLGIPTEVTCLPSVKEGYALVQRGKINEALSTNVISSVIGSAIALVLSCIIFAIGNNYSLLYNYKLQVAMLCVTILLTVASHANFLYGLILLIAGYVLGIVGVNPLTRETVLTFGNPYLVSGIPLVIVLSYLYGIPSLLNLNVKKYQLHSENAFKLTLHVPLITIIRSSIIGFVCGFIPLLGPVIGSNLSYSITKLVSKNYNHDGDVRGLASSDAGHNSALVASAIPLFCFAIPILTSEYILYDATTHRGMVYNLAWLLQNFWWVFGIFALANVFGFITSWPLAIRLIKIIALRMQYFKVFGIALMIGSVFSIGLFNNQISFFVVLSCIFAPLGYFLRKTDTLPLIIGFLIAQQFNTTLQIVYKLIGV